MKHYFEHLPQHVISKVIQYVAADEDAATSTRLFSPLLNICSLWRHEALRTKYLRCKILVSDQLYFYHKAFTRKVQTHFDIQAHSSFVKHLTVTLNYASIADASAFKMLNEAGLNFPSTHTFHLKINMRDVDTADIFSNLKLLVHLLLEMAPAVLKCSLHVNTGDGNYTDGALVSIKNFLLDQNIFYSINMGFPFKLDLEKRGGSQLSYFKCIWDGSYKEKAQIIHANAKTLETLQISYLQPDGYASLVLDEHGSPMCYPHLQFLYLDSEQITVKYLPSIGDAVPFARLKHLEVSTGYLFNDDIFFRGNEKTLTSLLLDMNHTVAINLVKSNVFTPARMKALKMVSILTGKNRNRPIFTDTTRKMFENIFMYAEELFVLEAEAAYEFSLFVRSSPTLYNLTTLSVTKWRFSLAECVSLLEHFPKLHSFTGTIHKIGEEYQGMDIAEISSKIRGNKQVLSSSIQKWVFGFPENLSVQVTSMVILLLIAGCPRLQTVRFHKKTKYGIDQVYRRLVSNRLYGKFIKSIVPAIDLSLKNVGLYMVLFIKRDVNIPLVPHPTKNNFLS